ncbi:MAG: cardiolipin synthase ClsB [Hydrogenophaga sp.]
MRLAATVQAGHTLSLLEGTKDWFPALIRELDKAQNQVQIETYILDMTGAGEAVVQALERTALRGVRVWLLVDGAGTGELPPQWRDRLDRAGVVWCVFAPFGTWGWFVPSRWRRLHRKLCVVDNRVAFCGGINILDDWHDPNHGALQRPRLDFSVQVQGPVVQDIHEAMNQLWWRTEAATQVRRRDLPEAFSALRATRWLGWLNRDTRPRVSLSGAKAGLLLRDNLSHRGDIERAYLKAIASARHEIVIANAYFLPGRRLRRALTLAASRGVRVRLLLQGRYEYFMQYHAARAVYASLLAAGIEIHEYQRSFLHAKVAVIDPHHGRPWATVGSSNLDPLSLLLAREANVQVLDAPFAQQLHQRLCQAMRDDGQAVSVEQFAQRGQGERLREWAALALMRLALWLTGRRY